MGDMTSSMSSGKRDRRAFGRTCRVVCRGSCRGGVIGAGRGEVGWGEGGWQALGDLARQVYLQRHFLTTAGCLALLY